MQFGKISHFVRDDRTVTLFVISSVMREIFPRGLMLFESDCTTTKDRAYHRGARVASGGRSSDGDSTASKEGN